MKKLALIPASAAVFFFFTAAIYMKYGEHRLITNGRPFASAQFVNGQWAMPLEDFVKLGGANVTLEPTFKLQNNELIALLLPPVRSADKSKSKIEASAMPDTFTSNKITDGTSHSQVPAVQHKVYAGGTFHVRKAGVISKNIFMFEGKAWIPLADVARAFGGTFTAPAGRLQPGQSLSLNFTLNGDGILAFNQ